MIRIKRTNLIFALFALLLCGATLRAQSAAATSPGDALTRARASLVEATESFKTSAESLSRLEQQDVERAEAKLAQLRQLFSEGLVSRREVERGEEALSAARTKVEDTRKQIADAEQMLAEVRAAEELAKAQPAPQTPGTLKPILKPVGSVSDTGIMIRYNGKTSWTLANVSGVQAFFASAFGRGLPASAFGQTETHNRLGFDHSRAVDVALHPDSAEGRALISYLRGQGIPFIAFRAAVLGSATGAHIHIGPPSHRI